MEIGHIRGATRVLGAPLDLEPQRHGACAGLPIRDAVYQGGLPDMRSPWFPTPEELARLQAGAPIYLSVIGETHPPVALSVGLNGEDNERATPVVEVATDAPASGPLVFPRELTPELREVLGIMIFQTSPIAHAFQRAGEPIKRRAEDEQAFVLHWLVTLALEHGADWRRVAVDRLDQLAAAAKASRGASA